MPNKLAPKDNSNKFQQLNASFSKNQTISPI